MRWPVIRECPACGSKLRMWCPGWFVWTTIAVQAVVTLTLNFVFIAPIAHAQTQLVWIPVTAVEWAFGWWLGSHLNDLWQHLWHWRHPTRCRQDHGHLAPAPGAA